MCATLCRQMLEEQICPDHQNMSDRVRIWQTNACLDHKQAFSVYERSSDYQAIKKFLPVTIHSRFHQYSCIWMRAFCHSI